MLAHRTYPDLASVYILTDGLIFTFLLLLILVSLQSEK